MHLTRTEETKTTYLEKLKKTNERKSLNGEGTARSIKAFETRRVVYGEAGLKECEHLQQLVLIRKMLRKKKNVNVSDFIEMKLKCSQKEILKIYQILMLLGFIHFMLTTFIQHKRGF